MTDEYYKAALELGVTELSELMKEREELDTRREELSARIAQVREGVLGLGRLAGYNPRALETQYPHLFPDELDPDMGLTDAVRKVLHLNKNFMTPVGVRTGLRTLGFDIDKYKNALASIHTVLKRLVEAGEVEPGTLNDNTAYRAKQFDEFITQGDGPPARPGAGYDPKPLYGPGSMSRRDYLRKVAEEAKAEEAKLPPRRPKPGHGADPPPSESILPPRPWSPGARIVTNKDKGKKEG